MTAAYLNFINTCSFLTGLNDTSIVLIPRKLKPEMLSDIRLIAFCNVLYKIVAKMLSNLIKTVLSSLVLKFQSTFVPRRAVTDNILISFEIMHFLKMTRKFDMLKAYDHIEWNFLQSMVLRLGFDTKYVDLIMLCVSTIRYHVV